RVRGTKSTEKVHNYYAQESEHAHREGQEALNQQNDLNKQQIQNLDQDYKTEHNERIQKFEADRKKAFELYRNQLAHDDAFYKKSLAQQKAEFDKIYSKNST